MANITLVTASGSTVTPKDDGLIYEVFSPGNGLIYGGVVSIKDSSTLHITAGHGIVCGRKFTIDDADIPVVLSGSGTLNGRLYIHLDLADVAEPIALLVETGSTLSPEVRDSDVNINNGVYDINIATFTVSTTTIADLVNIDNHIAPIDFGTADISGIGDGSIKGAISELNADLMELSNVKYASWKNTEVSGSGQGSNTLMLSNGTYLVIGQTPYTDVEYTACIQTDDSSQVYIAEQSGKNLINMSTIFKVTNGSTHVWVANYSSATLTYQDISKGYIKAIRVGD